MYTNIAEVNYVWLRNAFLHTLNTIPGPSQSEALEFGYVTGQSHANPWPRLFGDEVTIGSIMTPVWCQGKWVHEMLFIKYNSIQIFSSMGQQNNQI